LRGRNRRVDILAAGEMDAAGNLAGGGIEYVARPAGSGDDRAAANGVMNIGGRLQYGAHRDPLD
jgi:hypothetical protein